METQKNIMKIFSSYVKEKIENDVTGPFLLEGKMWIRFIVINHTISQLQEKLENLLKGEYDYYIIINNNSHASGKFMNTFPTERFQNIEVYIGICEKNENSKKNEKDTNRWYLELKKDL